jgi:hypothetical protein
MKSSAFAVYKDVDGNPRWFGWVTNKWRDRDHVANPDKGGEILTDQAHKDYVGWVDEAPELRMPKLLAWHQLETAHKERADWMDYADGFLLASGPLTAKEAEAIERVEKTYDLGMSHGFIALSKDPNEGLIDSYRSFEVSFLPLEVAANPWTDFRTITKEVFAMGLTENKRGFLRNLMGDEFVEEVEQENSDKATTLEEAGVDFKEGEEDELVESGEIDLEGEAEAAEEEPEEEKAQMESDKDEDEDEEEEEEKELEPAPDPVAELRDEMKDALVAVGEVLFEIKEEIAGMKQSREEVDEKIEKAIEESPAASLRDMFQKSAIGAEEARVDGRTSEAKDGPEETDPNPKKEGFGIPVLEAIKQANLRHYEQ